MALNKFMHPRNIYKTPPDFSKLAKKYKEFSDVAKDITGKVSIDFKDPHALRTLTKYLLKSDFNLDVNIPEDRLVPTLPLRLNYILWIEDLLTAMNKNSSILGIDIGTGACAIYPLLAAVKNKWNMLGTEMDEESLEKARDNIERNNLQHLIELKKNVSTSIFECVFTGNNDQVYDFCMCNPPFYTNIQELLESRSPARPEPKNGFTGSSHELITEGGELQFCRKIIAESKIYKNRILIFTTMVGHKYNLKELILDLKAESIEHTTTEFCQGRVTRWGLAWTYKDYHLSKLVVPKHISRKKNVPLIIILPDLPEPENDINSCLEKIKVMLIDLKITFKVINKRRNEISLSIIAYNNTWSNQRRKRRLSKQTSEIQHKQPKHDLEMHINEKPRPIDISNKQQISASKHKEVVEEIISNEASIHTDQQEIIVHGIMKIFMKDNHPNVELEFLNGKAGKEGLHQVIQYIKNNWK
ncbi:U6 small nuclear RNA (adenine-(43)-N(6))-methyltransferase isoform X2 [Nymphalis io]|uniref:U6 small nuclear RNA (adenine-(43)-N(6))-methyltransferase isoform X2 n=1 Tax=Inachis io TaxID=171585 RepID=UPI0021679F50|nr:U6 small nuclear RNA (adenine-(43)-N(6))-methyltransferase isoform X2 [Nymphalis io]